MISKNSGKRVLVMALLALLCTSCTHKKQLKKEVSVHRAIDCATTDNTSNRPMITVWIHGTRLFKFLVNPLDEYIHAAPPIGITPIKNLTQKHRLVRIAKTLAATDPYRFDTDLFYAFGWSGDLSFEEREKAALKLYEDLKKIVAQHASWIPWKRTPGIRLITHSHGCNVVLNLAKIAQKEGSLVINEAIFLAGPVQQETRDFAQSPCFKKIYSLYSTLDSIQILDPQGMYKTEKNEKRRVKFSERRFPHSERMRQAKIKINGHGLPHVAFILKSFLSLLPRILDELDEWEKAKPAQENQERLLTIKTR